MLIPQPFRLQAIGECPAHAELALSLAAEFGPVYPEHVDRELVRLAAEVTREASSPRAQLEAIGELVGSGLRCAPPLAPDALLLDRVLERRCGCPELIALVLVEVGARRGWPLGIVATERFFVAHLGLEDAVVLDPATGALLESERLPGPLRWRCAHETAGEILTQLEREWLRWGNLSNAIRSAELRLALPLDDDSLRGVRLRLRRLRARLN